MNRFLNPSETVGEPAEATAKGTAGVREARNALKVVVGKRDANKRQYPDARDFGDYVNGATIAAKPDDAPA